MSQLDKPGRQRLFSVGRHFIVFGLLILTMQLVFFLFVVEHPWFDAYLGANATAAAELLKLVGQEVQVSGARIYSVEGGVTVKRGCDAFQPIALLVANVLAFPARRTQKLIGIAVGIGIFLALNLTRIASLYLFAIHYPKSFESWHLIYWPLGLIALSAVIWILWARWTAIRG